MKPYIKKNLSFISNQQLIQNMKNRSSKNLSRNRSVETNISLIEKKNYEGQFSSSRIMNQQSHNNSHRQSLSNTHAKIENQSQNTNPNTTSNISKTETQSKSLIRFLRQNITNKKLLTQVQSLVQKISPQQPSNINNPHNYQDLLQKNSDLYAQKLKLKKQKKNLQNKIKQITTQYESKYEILKQQNQRLHKLVLKQSQMITNQISNQDDQAEDFRKMLVTQAKVIESLRSGKEGKIGWRAVGSR